MLCWGLQSLQCALGPGQGSVDALSVACNSHPFSCDKLSLFIIIYYSVMGWDRSALHCRIFGLVDLQPQLTFGALQGS